MNHKRWRIIVGLMLALALVAAACGSDDDDGGATDTTAAGTTDTTTAPTTDTTTGTEPMATPGEGVSVSMARANWDTGYFQAAVYKALLEELGYEVSDPSQSEIAPSAFYPALAQGDYDFWVNGWFPIHDTLMAAEVPGGGTVADVAQKIGLEMEAGGLQGFVVDKATADANGITMLDDIANDPALAELFDTDGNGKAEIMSGCNDGWGCQIVIDTTITNNGWEDILEQKSGEYAALFADVVARYQRGEPVLTYTWTPSAYITQLVPGNDVVWLSVANPNEDQIGAASLPPEQCPGQPCEMGFVAADIHVVARNDFLAANPAASKLFELVKITVTDVALQNVLMAGGENTQPQIDGHAADWIATNRDLVDGWLAEAIAAAG